MKVTPFHRWYDLWVGAFWDRKQRTLYVCPLPTLGLKIELRRRRFPIRVEHRGFVYAEGDE